MDLSGSETRLGECQCSSVPERVGKERLHRSVTVWTADCEVGRPSVTSDGGEGKDWKDLLKAEKGVKMCQAKQHTQALIWKQEIWFNKDTREQTSTKVKFIHKTYFHSTHVQDQLWSQFNTHWVKPSPPTPSWLKYDTTSLLYCIFAKQYFYSNSFLLMCWRNIEEEVAALHHENIIIELCYCPTALYGCFRLTALTSISSCKHILFSDSL